MTKESLTDGIGHIIEPLLARQTEYAHAGLFPRPHPQEPSRNEILGVAGVDFIAGNLLAHEGVVRLVFVE